MKDKLRYIVLFILLLLTVNALIKIGSRFSFSNKKAIGMQAPKGPMMTVNSGYLNLDEYRENKNTIMFFWTTWCPHCRRQLKGLNMTGALFDKKDIKLILVNVGQPSETVQTYLENSNIKMESFLDLDGILARKYGIVGFPTYLFIDKSGVIKASENALPENFEKFFTPGSEEGAKEYDPISSSL